MTHITKFDFSLDELMTDLFCPHCKELNAIRNPTGKCDHLYLENFKHWQELRKGTKSVINSVEFSFGNNSKHTITQKMVSKQKILDWCECKRSYDGWKITVNGTDIGSLHVIIFEDLKKFLEEL